MNQNDSIEEAISNRAPTPVLLLVFLFAITWVVTAMALLFVFQGHGYELNYWSHPMRAGIIMGTLEVSQVFLFVVSPFLFFKLRTFAIVGWIVALLSLAVGLLPPFTIYR